MTDNLLWRKSSYSNGQANCVEVGFGDSTIAVRDTKDKGRGPILRFTQGEWDAFVAGVAGGEFNRP